MEPAMCYHWVHEPSRTLGNMLGFMAEESLCLPKAETAPQRTQKGFGLSRVLPFAGARGERLLQLSLFTLTMEKLRSASLK